MAHKSWSSRWAAKQNVRYDPARIKRELVNRVAKKKSRRQTRTTVKKAGNISLVKVDTEETCYYRITQDGCIIITNESMLKEEKGQL